MDRQFQLGERVTFTEDVAHYAVAGRSALVTDPGAGGDGNVCVTIESGPESGTVLSVLPSWLERYEAAKLLELTDLERRFLREAAEGWDGEGMSLDVWERHVQLRAAVCAKLRD